MVSDSVVGTSGPPGDGVAAGVVPLVGESLYRVGTSVPVDGRVSWVPEAATGAWPANCYVLRDGDDALVIDPGFVAMQDAVVGGLRSVLPTSSSPTLFVTRSQYDCLGAAGAVAAEFGLKDVYTGGSRTNPFDSFEAVVAYIKQRKPDLGVEQVTRSPVIPVSDKLSIKAYPVKLRILATFWAYDAETKTLFTSDSFTHGMVADEAMTPVIDSLETDATTPEQVKAQLLASFHWLAHADDTKPVVDDVRAIFEQNDVEIIAPVRGRVLKGRDVVERHYGLLMEALSSFGGRFA